VDKNKRKRIQFRGLLIPFTSDINMPTLAKIPMWADHINKLDALRQLVMNMNAEQEAIIDKSEGDLIKVINNVVQAKKGQLVYYYDSGSVYGIASAATQNGFATHVVTSVSGETAFLTAFGNKVEVAVNAADGESATPKFWLYLNGTVTDDQTKIQDQYGVPQNGCKYLQVIGTRSSKPNEFRRAVCTLNINEPDAIAGN